MRQLIIIMLLMAILEKQVGNLASWAFRRAGLLQINEADPKGQLLCL